MHEKLKWRVEDSVMRLRAKAGNGKTAAKPREYALWTNGDAWALYADKWDSKAKLWKGVLVEEGAASAGLAVPTPSGAARASARLMGGQTGEAHVTHMV